MMAGWRADIVMEEKEQEEEQEKRRSSNEAACPMYMFNVEMRVYVYYFQGK